MPTKIIFSKQVLSCVNNFNRTQSAEGGKTGLWTTVVAAAILLP